MKYPETDPDTWESLFWKEVLQIRREAIDDYLINGTIVYNKHVKIYNENPSSCVQKLIPDGLKTDIKTKS